MGFLEVLTYAAGIIFVVAFAAKIIKYFRMPMHVRWELYPVPHEGKEWGGSFYEDVDFWTKEPHKDHMAQYKFMVPEILFIRALYEHNRPLWRWSFPFHFALYLGIAGLAMMVLGALLQIWGYTPTQSAFASLIQSFTVILYLAACIFGVIGSLGLLFFRASNKELSDVSAPIDYINLVWIGAMFGTGFLVWLADPGLVAARNFLVGLITFDSKSSGLSWIHVINLLIFLAFLVYFPFTHMTHMVSKYFMWDTVKWDDVQNKNNPKMDAKIGEYLSYPVSWSAEHIDSGGKKNWAEVATSNPFQAEEKPAEQKSK